MSRRMLYTLIAIMAIVMGGLILVQFNSLKQASDIKEEQFEALAKRAIDMVIMKLEANETNLAQQVVNYRTLDNPLPRLQNSFITLPGGSSVSLIYSQQNMFGSYREELQFSVKEDKKDEGDNPTRGESEEEQAGFIQLTAQNIMRRRAMEARIANTAIAIEKQKIQSRRIEERIDSTVLVNLLKDAFQECRIDLDYNIAVKSFQLGQEKTILSDPDYNPGVRKSIVGNLFPNDINDRQPNYLYVDFPKRSGYLIKQTGIMVIPSIILTSLLIAIFVYTILIILRQKKLSLIKNDFINNMTHELKTPIATISLASQMLEDTGISNTPTTIAHVAKVISQESKRLGFQVEKVLQMAVFNEGKLKLKFRELHLNEIVNKVYTNFEIRVKSKNGVLSADLSASMDEINGDEVHITNVIFNLLDNALKYSKEDPQIKLATATKKDFVVISVKDNGIGIAKDHQNQIFERFFRVPTGNVHDVKGFGLGLSYVKKIVDAHNGKIKVESILNKGTKFSLYFPINTIKHGTKS